MVIWATGPVSINSMHGNTGLWDTHGVGLVNVLAITSVADYVSLICVCMVFAEYQ